MFASTFDDRLRKIKKQGNFVSLADTVREAVEVSGPLQSQAQQGYTEVAVRNPKTGQERVLVIRGLHSKTTGLSNIEAEDATP